MDINLVKKPGLPYYLQLKEFIKRRIQSGELKGKKLPPVRQLAREFGISVNTVLRAYEGLQKEGIVTGSVGRGTFITTTPQVLNKQNREMLLKKLIEHALEEALSLEYTIEEFGEAVHSYVQEKMEMMEKIKLAFIECNIEQVLYFTDHLELDPHIHRIPVLLKDVQHRERDIMEELEDCDIIVTSFYHLDEMRELLETLGIPIIGINLEPEINTIIRIAKIPAESTVGIVATSEAFQDIIKEILDNLNLRFSRILETNSENHETVKNLVQKCDAVLVSPKQKHIVASYAKNSTAIIEFVFTPDRTSINNLKVALLELKNSQLQ